MATPPDDSLPKLVPATGVNNLGDERAQTPATLREAVNVDINREGRPRRRAGRTRLVAAPQGSHSLFAQSPWPYAVYVHGTELTALDPSMQPTVVQGGLAVGLPASMDVCGNGLYWSNGVQSGVLTPELDSLPWAPQNPNGQPLLQADAAGGLAAGGYQVAVTFRDLLGRESGASTAAQVDIEAGQGIRLTSIPQPTSPSVTTVRIYRTDANDTSLRHVRDLPVGITTLVLGSGTRGRLLETQHLAPLPAGHIVRYGHSRQWVARGNELLWSDSFRYGLYNPGHSRIRFGGHISMVRPVGDGEEGAGVYVAAGGRTYWLPGADPANFSQRVVDSREVVEGTDAMTLGSVWGIETSGRVAVWLSRGGFFCIGTPGGTVIRLLENTAATDVAERGAALYREKNGIRQFVASLQGRTAPNQLRIGDQLVATTLGPYE